MQVTSTTNGPEVVITVAGEIDADTSPSLDAAIAEVVGQGIRSLVVDLEEVTFLGSSGLSVLIGAQRSVESFELRRGNRIVDRLITLTGLERLYGSATSA